VRCTPLPEKAWRRTRKTTRADQTSDGGQHTTGALKISISKIAILSNEIFY
jgi:hypothetical protein